MNNQEAYNIWASNYDLVKNRTRDLEDLSFRKTLSKYNFTGANVLEIGCGTGKNTEWLSTRVQRLIAADFSEEMLGQAKKKIQANNVEFHQMDLNEKWTFAERFDVVTCSLVLEHIENINFIFGQVASVLKPGGLFYMGEFHPFKQYQGRKTRFERQDDGKLVVLDSFVHHVSDFFQAAKSHSLDCVELKEWFDDNDQSGTPRILTVVFHAKN